MAKDYYQTLGVEKNASKDELKKAFHKLAHKYHPDKNNGDDAKFKELNEAYQVLSDDKKRQQYDQFGTADFSGYGGANPYGQAGGFEGFDFDMGDLGDIFGDFFGGNMRGNSRSTKRRGRDIATEINLTFKEAIFGSEKVIRIKKRAKCDTCEGSGGDKNAGEETCNECKGSGHIVKIRRTILGAIQERVVCEKCDGIGKITKKKCKTCSGHGFEEKQIEFTINVPAGSSNGDTLRLSGGGEYAKRGESGDLYITLRVGTHAGVERDGYNLVYNLSISVTDAILGGSKELELIDGKENIKIAEGSHHGNTVTISGRGIPHPHGSRGNAIVRIHIDIPKKISKKAHDLIQELKKEGL